jgi:Protein of unknown function (DUF3098)
MAKVTAQSATVVAPKATTEEFLSKKNNSSQTFMFSKQNYQIMLAGLALIIVGFMLMSGGRSEDPNVFDYKEIYSFRRITLAPILVMLGFIVEIVAIMWMPKAEQE